jgi:sarcosine oxidase subunit beta
MRTKADAVVIGGGIIGVAVAFYLARKKYGQIVILEKELFLGSGSTAKAAGGIRAQFSNKANIEMSMLSEQFFAQFEEETGYDAVFDQVGYLFLVSDDKDVEDFKRQNALQRSLGLNSQIVTPAEIADIAPNVRLDDIKMGTFCHDDGLGDPHQFLTGYEQAVRRMGVDVELEAEVTAITTVGDKITGIRTKKGDISCPIVVNASGAYAGLIGRMVGADVKVEPYRRQCVTTGELDFIPPTWPMVVDVKSGLYTHKESKGLLLGWADKSVKPSFDVSIDPDYTDQILERGLNRIPKLETAEIANMWAGLYETTPDHRAIIGHEPTVHGMFHVTGFSGHGFMHAPAAGQVTAEILCGEKPSIDISSLSPERFVKGEVPEETNVI